MCKKSKYFYIIISDGCDCYLISFVFLLFVLVKGLNIFLICYLKLYNIVNYERF